MLALQDRCDGDTQVHPKFAFVYESHGRLVMRKLKNEKLFTQLGHEDEWDCPLRGDQHLSCREAILPGIRMLLTTTSGSRQSAD